MRPDLTALSASWAIASGSSLFRRAIQRPAGLTATINRALDGIEQIRLSLYFIQSDMPVPLQKSVRVLSRQILNIEIVERQVAAVPRCQLVGQRALSDLPGAGYYDGGHHPKLLG